MTHKPSKFKSLNDAAEALRTLRDMLATPNSTLTKAPAAVQPAQAPKKPDSVEQALRRRGAERALPHAHHTKQKAVVPAKKGKKGAPAKEILKAPGLKAFAAELAKKDAARLEYRPDQPVMPDHSKIKLEAFNQIRDIVAKSAPQIEPRPLAVSLQTQHDVDASLAEGARAFVAHPGPDLDNGFLVGFDFGTSSLKLAVRQPYQAGDPVVAMPAPEELRSMGHSYLWQTAIWFDTKSQSFSLTPGPNRRVLAGFKAGIIGGLAGELLVADLPVTRGEAAVAFVALHLAHMLGWYRRERPLGTVGGQHFLSINIGIPVSTLDDLQTFNVFKRIVAAAHSLAQYVSSLSHAAVREAFNQSAEELPDGYMLVPELTAAIAGYAAEPTAQPGSHLLVDVGASTLDIVAFNLVGRKRIAVFSAAVELLGSAALDVTRSVSVDDGQFKRACDHQFNQVYDSARSPQRAADGFCPSRRRRPVQLITTGGGCVTDVHARFIDEMPQERVLGDMPKVRPTLPETIASGKCDRSRLLLAYGLTRDIQELLDLRLPSQVPSITPTHSVENFYASKDMI